MNGEIWKPIVGYEGLYEVSNKGRVHSLPRMVHYNSGYEKRNNGKILTPSKASKYKNCDYYRVSLSKDNKAKAIPVEKKGAILSITLTETSTTTVQTILNG